MIVSIETSQEGCSVAIHQQGVLMAFKQAHVPRSAAAELMPFMDSLYKENNLQASDVWAVAVSNGPGSYTGLRVGLSTAKGLCMALNKPLITLNTLAVMAFQMKKMGYSGCFMPLIDARRMDVFYAIYSNEILEIKPSNATRIDFDFIRTLELPNPLICGGSGMAKLKEWITNYVPELLNSFQFVDEGILPNAKDMGALAQEAYDAGAFANLAYSVPFYGKEFWAGK